MDSENNERQENELLALQSIYGEQSFMRSSERNGGEMFIYVQLPENFKVNWKEKTEIKHQDQAVPTDSAEKTVEKELAIQCLPPVILNFTLPDEYPSSAPPKYTLASKWLSVIHLTKLCGCLDNVWNEQGPDFEVLFEWIQLLTDNTLSILEITSSYHISVVPLKYRTQSCKEFKKLKIDPRTHQDVTSVTDLITYLIDYDLKERENIFNQTYFNCGVCFNEKIGSDCISFPLCNHVYCMECMTDYFNIQIADGSVRALTCPEDKCETQADPLLVKKLVPADVYDKYDKFLLQSTLECMNEITYCPRLECQSAVLIETDDNLGRCPGCHFVFCALCKRSYHGVAKCSIKNEEMQKLRNEYLSGTAEQRAEIERRYGKKKLTQAVEEHYSEAWLETFSKKCPECSTNIQKIDGCNKMTCYKCRKNFCWLCCKILTGDPYLHFNDQKTGCFNKLFHGIEIDEFDEDSEDEDGWVNFVRM